MVVRRVARSVLLATLLLPAVQASPARAQSAGEGGDRHVLATFGDGSSGRGGHNRSRRNGDTPPAPASSLARPREVWPRLDAGAVLCRSRDDLVARARLEADSPGTAPMPPGCHLIRAITGVTVVDRVPPGATQVKLAGGEVGWTDTYVSERPPGG